jgi:hypothetical protein
MHRVLQAIGTKFSSRWGDQMVDLAINAVRKVTPRAAAVVMLAIAWFWSL